MRTVKAIIAIFSTALLAKPSSSWSGAPFPSHPFTSHNNVKSHVLQSTLSPNDGDQSLPSVMARHCQACIAASILLMTTPLSLSAHAAVDSTSSPAGDLSQSLVQPTDQKPQITLSGRQVSYGSSTTPSSSISQPKVDSLCQGMVYLFSEQDRPDPSEVLVLTAASPSQPNVPILGAKFNVYKAKFPFQFTMAEPNRLKGHDTDTLSGDFIVTARTCPSDGTLPCADSQSTFVARGISKVLVGMDGEGGLLKEGQSIRTPASLALRRNGGMP